MIDLCRSFSMVAHTIDALEWSFRRRSLAIMFVVHGLLFMTCFLFIETCGRCSVVIPFQRGLRAWCWLVCFTVFRTGLSLFLLLSILGHEQEYSHPLLFLLYGRIEIDSDEHCLNSVQFETAGRSSFQLFACCWTLFLDVFRWVSLSGCSCDSAHPIMVTFDWTAQTIAIADRLVPFG